MCDYSLQSMKSRPAVVGDKLVVRDFGTGTRGFAPQDSIDDVAVCVMPGTEIAFEKPIEWYRTTGRWPWGREAAEFKVGIFRQINKDRTHAHHDAIELPDGKLMLLTLLADGQRACVLQLPAEPKTEAEAQEQTRLEVVA